MDDKEALLAELRQVKTLLALLYVRELPSRQDKSYALHRAGIPSGVIAEILRVKSNVVRSELYNAKNQASKAKRSK